MPLIVSVPSSIFHAAFSPQVPLVPSNCTGGVVVAVVVVVVVSYQAIVVAFLNG